MEYIKEILFSVLKAPVFLVIAIEAVYGSFINAVFQRIADSDFDEKDDYPNLQSDGEDEESDTGSESESDYGSSAEQVNNLEFLDLGDEDGEGDDQLAFTDEKGVLTPDDHHAKIISPTPQHAQKNGWFANMFGWTRPDDFADTSVAGKNTETAGEDSDSSVETLD